VHGLGKIEASLSDYYMIHEIQNTYRGMMITIPPEKWIVFASFSQQKLAAVLLKLAHKVRLKRFLKQPRSQEEERPSSMRPASSPSQPSDFSSDAVTPDMARCESLVLEKINFLIKIYKYIDI
jgi:hypothetical protein